MHIHLKLVLFAIVTSLGVRQSLTDGAPTTASNEEGETNVTLVQLLFRHGDRSPLSTYTRDKYQESSWPYGFGELTDIGAMQAFLLGRFLRERFVQLRILNLSESEVYARSTSIPRAVLTGNAVMAGLMLPDTVKDFNPRKDTQPIQVHHPELKDEALLDQMPCPKKTQLMERWKSQSAEWKKFIKKYQKLFKSLSEITGSDVGPNNTVPIADAVFCEIRHHFPQPDNMVGIISELMAYFNESTMFSRPTRQIQQLSAGPLLERMFHNIHKAILKQDQMKIYAYSAHDSNIIGFLSALGVYNNIQPPYVSCVMLELHQKGNVNFIRLLYRNDTQKEPHILKIPGCGELCHVAQIQKLLQNVTLNEESKATQCRTIIAQSTSTVNKNAVPLAVGGVMLFFLVVAAVGFIVHRQKRKSEDSVQYRKLMEDAEKSLMDSDDDEL